MDNFTLKFVLSYTTRGSDYKNFVLVCKQWHAVINELFPGGDAFCNHLSTLLMKFPNKNWNKLALQMNPNTIIKIPGSTGLPEFSMHYYRMIDFNIVMIYPDLDWNYWCISSWTNIDWDYVEANLWLPWSYSQFSKNPSVPWEFITRNRNGWWSFYDLSLIIDINIILQNPNENWSWDVVVQNNSINWNNIWLIQANRRNFSRFCRYNKNIMNDIEKYIKYVDFRCISHNSHLSEDFIAKYLNNCNCKWDFEGLSLHIAAWKIAKNNLDKPWDYNELSTKAIPLDDLIKHIDKPWNYETMSNWATLDYVRALPYKHWNIGLIVQHSKLSEIDLYALGKKSERMLSSNPNLTWRYVVDNADKIKWDFTALSHNLFGKSI